MIITFKKLCSTSCQNKGFLASKTSLSIADHLQATSINRSTCQAYTETLKMPLTHKQPKKWWTNRQTDRQTNRQTKHSTPAAHARAPYDHCFLWSSSITENGTINLTLTQLKYRLSARGFAKEKH